MPPHWPADQGLEVCALRRVLWLPPGWAQAWKMDSKGFKRKMYVAPESLAPRAVYNKSQVQDMVGYELMPVDHDGNRLPQNFPDHWPNWLPRDWQIGFNLNGRQNDTSAPSFRNSAGDLFGSEAEAKRHLKQLGCPVNPPHELPENDRQLVPAGKVRQRKPKPQPDQKHKRLRKMTLEQIENLPEPGMEPVAAARELSQSLAHQHQQIQIGSAPQSAPGRP